MNKKLFLLVLFCGFLNSSFADEPIEFKTLPLNDFMQDSVAGFYPISIPVPKEYIAVDPNHDELDEAFWMTKADKKHFLKTQYLPENNGHMRGEISLNVGYDQAEDLFMGAEEEQYLKKSRRCVPSSLWRG